MMRGTSVVLTKDKNENVMMSDYGDHLQRLQSVCSKRSHPKSLSNAALNP